MESPIVSTQAIAALPVGSVDRVDSTNDNARTGADSAVVPVTPTAVALRGELVALRGLGAARKPGAFSTAADGDRLPVPMSKKSLINQAAVKAGDDLPNDALRGVLVTQRRVPLPVPSSDVQPQLAGPMLDPGLNPANALDQHQHLMALASVMQRAGETIHGATH
jgi:hypothetical protein